MEQISKPCVNLYNFQNFDQKYGEVPKDLDLVYIRTRLEFRKN